MPNKADLISKIAEEAGLTTSQAEAAFNALISGIADALKKGGRITIAGLGTFSVVRPRRSAARRDELKFTASKRLRRAAACRS